MISTRFSSSPLFRTAAVFAGAALLTGCAAGGPPAAAAPSSSESPAQAASTTSGGSRVARDDAATEKANLAVVTRLFSATFPDPDSAEARAAAAASVEKDATVHGGNNASGPAGLLAQFAAEHKSASGAQAVIKRTAADGDLVAVHCSATSTTPPRLRPRPPRRRRRRIGSSPSPPSTRSSRTRMRASSTVHSIRTICSTIRSHRTGQRR